MVISGHRAGRRRVPLHFALAALLGVGALLVTLLLPLASASGGPAPVVSAAPRKLRWAYHVNFDSDTGYKSLQAHIHQIDYLSPRWYLMDAGANLTAAPDPNRAAITALARAHGVRLVPYVRNTAKYNDLHRVLVSPSLRERAVANVTDMVLQNGYDGVHFDLEDITASDGPYLTQFMAAMYAALHPHGKLVTQSIGPKTADGTTGFSGAYDYAELAKYNDFIVIMAYNAAGKTPRAPAAYKLVEDNARYAASRIPPEKVLLGSAWYGFDYNRANGTHADLRYADVAQRLERYRPTVQWDATSRASYFTYYAGGVRHDVWFEDARSVAEKLGLVYKYDLAGAAGWRLGQEDPAVWDAFGALGTGEFPVSTPAPEAAAPVLQTPAPQARLSGLGTALRWANPPDTTQYHIQIMPYENDGPGIDLIRSAAASYTVPEPSLGRGDYVMLPDMTYTWRVRTTGVPDAVGPDDPRWGPWSEPATFRTGKASAGTVRLVSPANGARVTGGTATLRWNSLDTRIFYYEVQVSPDSKFVTDPGMATAAVWWNLVHGGQTTPENSWQTPQLEPGTYYWRVRPRIQGDGTPVPWSAASRFVAR